MHPERVGRRRMVGVLLVLCGAAFAALLLAAPLRGADGLTCLGLPVTITENDSGQPIGDDDDVVTRTDGDDVIKVLGGDDRVDALGQNDVVCGGGGKDDPPGGGGKEEPPGPRGKGTPPRGDR